MSRLQSNPRALTGLSDVLSCMSQCQAEEDTLSIYLAELLKDNEPVLDSVSRLRTLAHDLDAVRQEGWMLSRRVSFTAKTAARIGHRVRTIDEEMGRVKEAGDHVSQVMDLRTSLSALRLSIESQDWESATRHCARVMSVPQEVLCGPFAETVVPTSDHHLPPSQVLELFRDQLLHLYIRNFHQASQSRDSAATSRFFKMFPAIGWEEQGLDVYSRFVGELVRARTSGRTQTGSPHYYTTTFTAMLENIALVVDQHQPIVDKYYGRGKMRLVVKHLLDECDTLVESLLNSWGEERSLQLKLSEISDLSSTSMMQSKRLHLEAAVDLREINKVIAEMASMVSRWNLFELFIADSLNVTAEEERTLDLILEDKFDITTSKSHQRFERLITTYYIPFEVWYLCRIIDKAHLLSDPDCTQLPVTTTTPDDVFYVLKVIITRLLSMGSVVAAEQTLERLRDTMERQYLGTLKKKLDDIFANVTTSRTDKIERENRFSYIVTLNDLDMSESHLERLLKDVMDGSSITQYFVPDQLDTVNSYISSFSSMKFRFQTTLKAGTDTLFNQLLRPRLRNMVPESFKDISYVLDDDAYAATQFQDIVRKRFAKAWEFMMESYKEMLTENNYRLFFSLAIDAILTPWEKVVTSMKFNELGAIRFDHDLRSIMSYLSSQIAFGDVRERFIRLQQISMLLNLDNEEDVTEFYNASGISWKLSIHEAKAVVGLKV
ncbi:hypothetical protein AX17_004358 [Amanita inopinata Kibby_2008]|nr:hypothetical protein AX17_004358 [Amanita inopinata Kibby_2008]